MLVVGYFGGYFIKVGLRVYVGFLVVLVIYIRL